MNYYVSTPTGARCLATCREHDFREMSCPVRTRNGKLAARDITVRLEHYALDNGAWIYHIAGVPCDWEPFRKALRILGPAADFVVVPDIVAGGKASARMSESWLPRVLEHTELALVPVQDGMETTDVEHLLGPRVGIFVGGSFAWKWTTLAVWWLLAANRNCHIHVGRVNTTRRANHCADNRIDSVDGSSVSRFSITASRFTDAIDPKRKAQENMPW